MAERRPTAEEIKAARTPDGGWTREQLAEWGVPWPPPKGWKKRLAERSYEDRYLEICALLASDDPITAIDDLHGDLARLLTAVKPILSAYRSESAHITEEQITEAWAAFDACLARSNTDSGEAGS